MNRNLFYSAVLVLLQAGCRERENVNQLKAINQSLQLSNAIIQDDCKLIYEVMQEKQKDPVTAMSAQIWGPKVELIHVQIDNILAKIESLKNDLLKQTDSLREEKSAVIKALHEPNGGGNALLNRIAAFKDSIPHIFNVDEFKVDNPTLYTSLYRNIIRLLATAPLLGGYEDSLVKNQHTKYTKEWLEDNFAGSSSLMSLVMLNKIENDVLATEKVLIEYCNNQTANIYHGYEVFHAIAALSSSYVKAGQTIEVTAGVGQFSEASKPTIVINGKVLKIDDDATATYRFIATGKPGKHSIPIKIEFTKPDGSQRVVNTNREYIIAEEK
jgi:hypothetical protein